MHPSDSQQSYAPPASPALHGNVPGASFGNPYTNGSPAGPNGAAPHGIHGMNVTNAIDAMNGTNGHHDARPHDPRPADERNLRPGARPTGMSYKFQRLREKLREAITGGEFTGK